jgi:D-beta-D-heptose 7-phosphate kinase/D-beta-D-heptose 1-phosphate adenosyltransferase
MATMNKMTKRATPADVATAVGAARKAGRRVAFTNGCFDILHAGHVRYLSAARATADMLVVGLNADISVRKIKGSHRPLNPEGLRAEVLAALACVDWVVLFDEPDPLALIRTLTPDVLVKGADWSEEEIIGADYVKQNGGQVVRVDLVPNISTTRLIQTIRERYC